MTSLSLLSIAKLSAVRKVLETQLFLALGSFGTLGPKLSHGTSKKFADVRTHLRKVLRGLYLKSDEAGTKVLASQLSLDCLARRSG